MRSRLLIGMVIWLSQLAAMSLLVLRTEASVALVAGASVAVITGALLFFVRDIPHVAAVFGGALAIVTAVALLIIAEHSLMILLGVPSFLGGILAIRFPDQRWALLVALMLVLTGAVLVLIGGEGLLYAPAVVALIHAMWAARPSRGSAESAF